MPENRRLHPRPRARRRQRARGRERRRLFRLWPHVTSGVPLFTEEPAGLCYYPVSGIQGIERYT